MRLASMCRGAVVVVLAVVVPALAQGCATGRGEFLRRSTVTVGGVSRAWYTYAAPRTSAPSPVVILLHGYGMHATQMLALTGIDVEARRDRFTVVLPEGVNRSWNAGTCCGAAVGRRIDDVGFLSVLVGELVRHHGADPSRVYLAGFSNGAMMTYRFACARPDLLHGAMVVEGALTSVCAPHRPVDLLVLHQTGDAIVPFAGIPDAHPAPGATGPYPPALAGLASWLTAIGCPDPFDHVAPPTLIRPVVRASAACPGRTTTSLETVLGGAHRWPHGAPTGVDALQEMVTAFHLRAVPVPG